MKRIDAEATRPRGWYERTVNRCTIITSLGRAFLAASVSDVMNELVDYVTNRPETYDLSTIQIPAVLNVAKVKNASTFVPFHRWLTACRTQLAARVKDKPREPADWSRPAELSCRCVICLELRKFLADPHTQTLRFPLKKEHRQHLHCIIDRHRCDTTHVTERKGRPFTLVCQKTLGTYERQCKAYQLDCQHLAAIKKIQAGAGVA